MFSQKSVKGFTLIELLVVVAIIGILATIVIGAVNSARIKGADAAVKGNMANMRASAELIFDSSSSYATVCNTTSKTYLGLWAALRIVNPNATSINTGSSGSEAASPVMAGCGASSTAWGAISPLRSNTSSYWCVDSTGSNRITSTPGLTNFACS